MAYEYPIDNGRVQNPYKEFPIVGINGTDLQPDETVLFSYDHRFFRVLSLSGSAQIELIFGDSGSITTIVGAGLGMKHPNAITRVRIRNYGAGAITGLIAMSMGDIFDDRLSVSGTVTVQPAANTCFMVENCVEDEVTVPIVTVAAPISAWNADNVAVTTASVTLIAANADRESIAIHAGTEDLYISPTTPATTGNSYKIPANASTVLTWAGAIYAIRASGSTDAYYSEQEE